MAATVIYQELPDATYGTKGAVRIYGANGLSVSDGVLKMDIATSGSHGTVMPDNTTITVDENGVISAKGYEDVIAELIERIEALEDALSDEMTYEDGTLVVNATLDGGTLVTGRTYEGGTLS